ncbi:MAG: nitroreductase, partial [Rhodobacteraceae bacterium]|nr:nitroreductase [Paracoccaceae bacterium]
LTGWHVHDKEFIKNGLGLKDNESVAGLIYIGTPSITPPERPRPNLDEIVEWQ